MNIRRFISLPNVLKPVLLLLIILTMIIVGATSVEKGKSQTGSWYFWLTIIIQLVVLSGVVVAFLFEMETLITCGRDQWPVVEMAYSAVFGIADIINMFIVANWNQITKTSGPFIVAALFIFALVILYGLGLVMMFRIWKGVVQSGASQNPTGNVTPGNTGNMHPGI